MRNAMKIKKNTKIHDHEKYKPEQINEDWQD